MAGFETFHKSIKMINAGVFLAGRYMLRRSEFISDVYVSRKDQMGHEI